MNFVTEDNKFNIEDVIHTPEKTGAAMKHLCELMDKHRIEHPEIYTVDAASGENNNLVTQNDYDPYTGKYAFCPPMTDEEFAKAYKDYMDEYRAGGKIRELKETLREVKDALFYMLLLHDSTHGHNMQKVVPILYYLQSDNGWTVQKAQEIFKKVCEYCEEDKI